MAKYPALPLFTDAFMADTIHLTTAQVGAYMLLLMAAWRAPDCSLPNDEKMLARIARMDFRTWKLNRDILLAFWDVLPSGDNFGDKRGIITQKRLQNERKYVDQLRSKNAANGRTSALKRLETASTTVEPEGQPKSNTHTHTHTIPSYIPNTVGHEADNNGFKNLGGKRVGEDWGRNAENYFAGLLSQESLNYLENIRGGHCREVILSEYLKVIKAKGMPKHIDKAFRAWLSIYVQNRKG